MAAISPFFAPNFTPIIKALVITGSSGLYESAMGESYPKRGDYEYIRKKAENVFYDPKVATKEIVDDVFETVNDRNKLIKTLLLQRVRLGTTCLKIFQKCSRLPVSFGDEMTM